MLTFADIKIRQLFTEGDLVGMKVSDTQAQFLATETGMLIDSPFRSLLPQDPVELCIIQNFQYLPFVTITDSKINMIISLVRVLAKNSPEAKYPEVVDCKYMEHPCGNGCGCIIGQALQIMGYDLSDRDKQTVIPRASELIAGLSIEATDEQLKWLDRVQWCQDHACSWSHAVEIATSEQPNV